MKHLAFAFISLLVFAAEAFQVSFTDAKGATIGKASGLDVSVERLGKKDGVETIRCRVRSCVDGTNLVRIVASATVPDATSVWDGLADVPATKKSGSVRLMEGGRFLFGGAHGAARGTVLGVGAADLLSFAEFRWAPAEGGKGVAISVEVPAALLGKGSGFSCSFHCIGYSRKYGIRDAFARYYPLYPKFFRRDPRVNPAAYGINAQYASWILPNPERCRFSGATWEWCHGSDRSWGDPLNREQPTGLPRTDYSWVQHYDYWTVDGVKKSVTNETLSIAGFDAMLDERFAPGYRCGVANAFYMMVLSKISPKIAARYPDSLAGANSFVSSDYSYATDVFTFPECSWGVELRRQLAELVGKHDLGAIAFDVSGPRPVYRGPRLAKMANVGWDAYGPGVVRGVGTARLCEFVRTLPNKKLSGTCAATVNSGGGHISDMLLADTYMTEYTPWDRPPPYGLPERFTLGEKGLTFWEGFAATEFDPNFPRWSLADKTSLINDLSRYAVWRSFAVGGSLPSHFVSEYTFLASRAFARMNDAGFKPVPGFVIEGDGWDFARYGLSDESYLAICNLKQEVRTAKAEVFPDEIASAVVGGRASRAGYAYAPFFGGKARHSFKGGQELVEVDVGSQLAAVLEGVGRIKGEGDLSVCWEGDFGEVRLVLESSSFDGAFSPRDAFETYRRAGAGYVEIKPGGRYVVAYRNDAFPGIADGIRNFSFPPEVKYGNPGKLALPVKHAPDADSREMAAAVAAFFKGSKTVEDASLPKLSVALEDGKGGRLAVSAKDREELSKLVRRFLDAVNAMRYPRYAPWYRMSPEDRSKITFVRW